MITNPCDWTVFYFEDATHHKHHARRFSRQLLPSVAPEAVTCFNSKNQTFISSLASLRSRSRSPTCSLSFVLTPSISLSQLAKLSKLNTKSRSIEYQIINLLFKHKPKTIFPLKQTRNYITTAIHYAMYTYLISKVCILLKIVLATYFCAGENFKCAEHNVAL